MKKLFTYQQSVVGIFVRLPRSCQQFLCHLSDPLAKRNETVNTMNDKAKIDQHQQQHDTTLSHYEKSITGDDDKRIVTTALCLCMLTHSCKLTSGHDTSFLHVFILLLNSRVFLFALLLLLHDFVTLSKQTYSFLSYLIRDIWRLN